MSQDADLILCLWKEGIKVTQDSFNKECESEANSESDSEDKEAETKDSEAESYTASQERDSCDSEPRKNKTRRQINDFHLDDKIISLMLQLLRRLKFGSYFRKRVK